MPPPVCQGHRNSAAKRQSSAVQLDSEASAFARSFGRSVSLEKPTPDPLPGFASERAWFESGGRLQRGAAFLCEPECSSLERDLRPELRSVPEAAAPAETLELALGGGESLGCAGALPLELLLLPGMQTRRRIA
jgi:hypothetical protein